MKNNQRNIFSLFLFFETILKFIYSEELPLNSTIYY